MPLPILSRISNKTLSLCNYGLNSGVCKGLAHALEGNPNLFTGIILDRNGIQDEEFADLLNGMQSLSHLKKIVYRSNGIRMLSIDKLTPLLAKQKPMQLEELRIINCPIGGTVTNALIEALVD